MLTACIQHSGITWASRFQKLLWRKAAPARRTYSLKPITKQGWKLAHRRGKSHKTSAADKEKSVQCYAAGKQTGLKNMHFSALPSSSHQLLWSAVDVLAPKILVFPFLWKYLQISNSFACIPAEAEIGSAVWHTHPLWTFIAARALLLLCFTLHFGIWVTDAKHRLL